MFQCGSLNILKRWNCFSKQEPCTMLTGCTSTQFRCANGQCVSSLFRCNGQTGGCSDGSNEMNCSISGVLRHDSMNWSKTERLRKSVIDIRKLPRGFDASYLGAALVCVIHRRNCEDLTAALYA